MPYSYFMVRAVHQNCCVMKIDPQMFVAANIKDIIFSINNIFYYCEIWLSDINVLM